MIQFLIKLASLIKVQDMRRIRLIYTPLIGAKTMMFYLLLIDELCISTNLGERELALSPLELTKLSGLDEEELTDSLELLDKYKLLERYKRETQGETGSLLLLLKPTIVNSLRVEGEVHKRLSEIVGTARANLLLDGTLDVRDSLHEEFSSSFEVSFNEEHIAKLKPIGESDNKDINEEITARFLETFRSKLKRVRPEAKVDTKTYIAQLTKKQPTKPMLATLKLAKESGFSDEALNIICHYAYTQNGRINLPFISTIITNFFRQETLDPRDIKAHLDRAISIKRQRLATLEEERRRKLVDGSGSDEGETLKLALSNDPANEEKLHDPLPINLPLEGLKETKRVGKRAREEEKLFKQEMISDILKNLEGD